MFGPAYGYILRYLPIVWQSSLIQCKQIKRTTYRVNILVGDLSGDGAEHP